MSGSIGATISFDKIAPVIPVRDLDAALDRYRRMGFSVHVYDGPERYGYADRGGVSLHFTEWDQHDPQESGAVVYVYVSDADAVYTEWSAAHLDGRLTEPQDTPYRLREFAYVDPDGTAHLLGSPLAGPRR